MASTRLATYPFAHEAWLASHRLAAAGIAATVSSHRAGLWGALPADDAVAELWVDDADAERAVRWLALEVIDGGRRRATPASCPACGAAWEDGFERCWSCSLTLSGG